MWKLLLPIFLQSVHSCGNQTLRSPNCRKKCTNREKNWESSSFYLLSEHFCQYKGIQWIKASQRLFFHFGVTRIAIINYKFSYLASLDQFGHHVGCFFIKGYNTKSSEQKMQQGQHLTTSVKQTDMYIYCICRAETAGGDWVMFWKRTLNFPKNQAWILSNLYYFLFALYMYMWCGLWVTLPPLVKLHGPQMKTWDFFP